MAAISFSRSASPQGSSSDSNHSDYDLDEVSPEHYLSHQELWNRLDSYNGFDRDLILKDLEEVSKQKLEAIEEHREIIFAAAGPMGGASTMLEKLLKKEDLPEGLLDAEKPWIDLDPLRGCLPMMENTYIGDVEHSVPSRNSVEYWWKAAGFLSEVLLAISLNRGLPIADGVTMSSPHAKQALDVIKTHYKYSTTLIHVSCHEESRLKSWRSCQSSRWSEKDFFDKNEEFYALLPYFVGSMDKILFCYWKQENEMVWAAKLEKRKLTIYDSGAFIEIQHLHSPELWETSVGPIHKH